MKKKYILSIITILFLLCGLSTMSFCAIVNNLKNNSLWINNINGKDIKIEIKEIETINSTINLDEIYDTYSIITIDITNIGLEYVELSNINFYTYQGDKKLQTFIQSKNEYLGFVGTLSSGEKKEIKVGVVLDNKVSPIKLVFENLSDKKGEKNIKVIDI